MSRKNFLRTQLLEGQSLSASFDAPATIIKYSDNCAYQINVTAGGSEGTFKVQASLDHDVAQPNNVLDNAGNWVDLDVGGVIALNGSADTILINLNQLPFNAIRLVYTSTVAGTSECDIWIVTKEIG